MISGLVLKYLNWECFVICGFYKYTLLASTEFNLTVPLGVIPGLQEYVDFFVSDEIAGPDGPLSEYGLVSDPELAATQAMVANGGTKMGPLN